MLMLKKPRNFGWELRSVLELTMLLYAVLAVGAWAAAQQRPMQAGEDRPQGSLKRESADEEVQSFKRVKRDPQDEIDEAIAFFENLRVAPVDPNSEID